MNINDLIFKQGKEYERLQIQQEKEDNRLYKQQLFELEEKENSPELLKEFEQQSSELKTLHLQQRAQLQKKHCDEISFCQKTKGRHASNDNLPEYDHIERELELALEKGGFPLENKLKNVISEIELEKQAKRQDLMNKIYHGIKKTFGLGMEKMQETHFPKSVDNSQETISKEERHKKLLDEIKQKNRDASKTPEPEI